MAPFAERENELLNLRKAMREDGFSTLTIIRKCQILTNIGNILSHMGRFVEAIEYWNHALDLDPDFAMARGNRGYGLAHYAEVLYDSGYRSLFLRSAYSDLSRAISGNVYDDARRTFEACRDRIERLMGYDGANAPIEIAEFSMGDSREEVRCRTWCLDNRLFLNPVNDLLLESIAAHDCLTIPSIVVPLSEGPYYPAFYNQLKQEYVSARYLYHEGISEEASHFSDRGVLLYDTLDYPAYSLATEKLKLAYRAMYSLLDKVAYFLNKYFVLNIPERFVYFRSIWFNDGKPSGKLRTELFGLGNWPLTGLFWLGKDLYEEKFQDTMEPTAQAMYKVRNHLEHKYLKLHDWMWSGPLNAQDEMFAGLTDSLAFSIYRGEFEEKALRLLKITRATLIYLSLAIFVEERRRASQREEGDLVVGMPLYLFEDEWKC